MRHMLFAIVGCMLFVPATGYSNDNISDYSIQAAMDHPEAPSLLGDEIRFYFGDQAHGEVVRSYGEFSTNKRTNAFNKSDQEACQWVFLSAMIALRDRAIREGGNAVVDIKSNYKDELVSSTEHFQCEAGTLMAGVTFVGTVVQIEP